ncbi:MAG: terpene cyclase/mutase family protein [Acidobacteriaceae bacterium]|nr:terpene cyclase/mutase family protein [Acidobacteriaceae bacterium]
MSDAVQLQRYLEDAQNADGGWTYGNGSSWTEPTALALLALEASGVTNTAFQRGCRWLIETQRSDGGWPPHPSVHLSTWVTSLATLALAGGSWSTSANRGLEWLVRQSAHDTTPVERFVFRLRGGLAPIQTGGSPWLPGTAAWIAPTAMSVIALSYAARRLQRPELRPLAHSGQQYILCHRCSDGGWNHGGSRYLSENATSYPEMTGMALLALGGVPAAELTVPLALAERQLALPGSLEGLCWLRLGLAHHGRDCGDSDASGFACRTTRDASLRLLCLAMRSSSNKFLLAFS